MSTGQSPKHGWGCLSTIGAVFAGCVLLVINGAIVVAAYSSVVTPDTGFWGGRQVTQLVFFIAPMLLLVMEWLVIDVISDRTRRRH